MEAYLNSLHDFESRKIIAKFRCSDHTLMIETGRHTKIDLEERICKMCSQKGFEMNVISSQYAKPTIQFDKSDGIT